MNLVSIYNQNKDKLPLFDKEIVLDWHDGLCTGFSKLSSTNEWYILNIFYFEVDKNIRIYNVVKAPDKWQDESSIRDFMRSGEGSENMKHITKFVDENKSSVLFLRTVNYVENEYLIVKPNVEDVHSCSGAEDAWHGRNNVLPMLLKYFPDMSKTVD